jgi:hypothetical protein
MTRLCQCELSEKRQRTVLPTPAVLGWLIVASLLRFARPFCRGQWALPILPARRSGHASAAAPPSSRLLGHVPECLRRLLVAVAAEGGEAGGGEGQLVDRRVLVLLEVAKQPMGGDPRMPGAGLYGRSRIRHRLSRSWQRSAAR